MKPKKFRRGEMLTPQQAFEQIADGRYVYWADKPQHPGWMGSMQINCIIWGARTGLIREAIVNEEQKQ